MTDPHDAHDHSGRSLGLALALNLLLTSGQIIGGLFSGSLALIADGLHNFSDAASLGIALFAQRLGMKPATQRFPFGYKRAETLAALFNLLALLGLSILLAWEAFQRFENPQPIATGIVLWLAAAGLVLNLVTARLLHHHHEASLNMRAAFLHAMGDALASLGVMLAAALVQWFGWLWADAAVTLLISLALGAESARHLPACLRLLMNSAPDDSTRCEALRQQLLASPGVTTLSQFRLWQADESTWALTAHLSLSVPPAQWPALQATLHATLTSDSLQHITLEPHFASSA